MTPKATTLGKKRPPPRLWQKADMVRRYLSGMGVPGLATDHSVINGIPGFEVLVSSRAVAPDTTRGDMARVVPGRKRAVIHVNHGRELEDSLVTLRLEEWAPMLAAWEQANRERLHGSE